MKNQKVANQPVIVLGRKVVISEIDCVGIDANASGSGTIYLDLIDTDENYIYLAVDIVHTLVGDLDFDAINIVKFTDESGEPISAIGIDADDLVNQCLDIDAELFDGYEKAVYVAQKEYALDGY